MIHTVTLTNDNAAIYDALIEASYVGSCAMDKNNNRELITLCTSLIPTPLGPMIVIGDDDYLYYLNFIDAKHVTKACLKLCVDRGAYLVSGTSDTIDKITRALDAYFAGTLRNFTTPLYISGNSFARQVWDALCQVPYGQTKNYADQASAIGKPSAYRAVANANAANAFAIVIPCHRIIGVDGRLSGYGGGVERKKWLIEHEQRYS